jgi:hypothetical protein
MQWTLSFTIQVRSARHDYRGTNRIRIESQGPLTIDDSNVDFHSYGQQDLNHFLHMDDPSVWSPTTRRDIDVTDHLL